MHRIGVRISSGFRSTARLVLVLLAVGQACAQRDPLPSWNDTSAKQAILRFVKDTTDKYSPGYVEPEDRIATFDQDETLGQNTLCTHRRCLRWIAWARWRHSTRSGDINNRSRLSLRETTRQWASSPRQIGCRLWL